MRQNTLVGYDFSTHQEHLIAASVRDVAATPDGRWLALVRELNNTTEIWVVQRDGQALRQLTNNTRTEGTLSWSADGQILAYTSANIPQPRLFDWNSWSTWCGASEVRLLTIADSQETTLATGCDPAMSPDGKRIAFATPPTTKAQGDTALNRTNAIRLVNRQGLNGWDFATAKAANAESGLLVYAPAWSPNGSQLAYHRFMGYQSLVDINMTEMGDSFEGNGQLISSGAGWLRPPLFSVDGRMMALVENNYSDARGYSGYEHWRTQILLLGVSGEVILPEGTRPAKASEIDRLFRSAGAAWIANKGDLIVALPSNWKADTPLNDPLYANTNPSEIWRWTPGSAPAERLVQTVDFASPLIWLPEPARP